MSHFATVLYVCRKEERSKQSQTNNKVKQHNTPKAVTFPKKNELPRVGLEEGRIIMSHFATVLYVCRKEERSKQSQTNNKVKQHNTPKAVTFPKKNELPRVGLEPTTLYTLLRALYH